MTGGAGEPPRAARPGHAPRRQALVALGALVAIGAVLCGPGACKSAAESEAEATDVCARANGAPGLGAGWFATVSPTSGSDSQRSRLFPSTCSPDELAHGRSTDVAVRKSVASFPGASDIVTRKRGELFVYGGALGGEPGAGGAYVAKVKASTLEESWRRPLIDASGRWNYPGSVGVHVSGNVYATYGDRIGQIDAGSGDVVKETKLPPQGEARDTVYDGFVIMPDGKLVVKSIGRGRCDTDGVAALLKCAASASPPSSIVAVVDPQSLAVLDQRSVGEPSIARVVAARFEGADYVYVVGVTKVVRLRYADGKLNDDPWGPVPYLVPGQSASPGAVVVGSWVVVQTNATSADAPLSVVAISQTSTAQTARLQPFKELGASTSYSPAPLAADPQANRVYAHDTVAGKVAAIDILDKDKAKTLTPAWIVGERSTSSLAIVGPAGKRVLVGTELRDVKGASDVPKSKREVVAWRESVTGRIVARSSVLERMVPGSGVVPGYDGTFFHLSTTGVLTAMTFGE